MKCNSTQKRTVYELSAIQKRYFFSENPFLFFLLSYFLYDYYVCAINSISIYVNSCHRYV